MHFRGLENLSTEGMCIFGKRGLLIDFKTCLMWKEITLEQKNFHDAIRVSGLVELKR